VSVKIGVSFLIMLTLLWYADCHIDRSVQPSKTPPVVATISLGVRIKEFNPPQMVNNDADLLVFRCGTPDRDEIAGGALGGQQINARMIEYAAGHLRFVYVPKTQEPNGSSSAYDWKYKSLVDTASNVTVNARQLVPLVRSRLPCALGN
jgi:hypothetical protein